MVPILEILKCSSFWLEQKYLIQRCQTFQGLRVVIFRNSVKFYKMKDFHHKWAKGSNKNPTKIQKFQLFNKSKSGRLPCKQAASASDTPKHLWILGWRIHVNLAGVFYDHRVDQKEGGLLTWMLCFTSNKADAPCIVGYRTWSPGLSIFNHPQIHSF